MDKRIIFISCPDVPQLSLACNRKSQYWLAMSLAKSTAVIGFFTLISRVAGFIRDVFVAHAIGASWISDAFFVAFKLPNFFRRIFAEGAFNAAFVPSFTRLLTEEGRMQARQFAAEVLSVLLVVLLLLNALFIIAMPFILPAFAPGFTDDPEKFGLTVFLARICFPYILFISLVSLLAGILNAMQKFAAASATPVLLNLCMIMGITLLKEWGDTPAHGLAFGVLVAGFVQLIWLAVFCLRDGMLPSLVVPRLTRNVRKIMKLMVPAILGSGVQQVNLIVGVMIASHIEDAVSYIYYADRIVQLPIGMIGVAVGTVLLPMLSRQIQNGQHSDAQESMNRGLELTMLFGLPSMSAFLVMSAPMTTLLYQHGAFSPEDARATTHALIAFGAGLPAFLAIKVLMPGFFAHYDTKTPSIIAALCVAINIALSLALIEEFRHVGIAIATSVAGWANALLLTIVLLRRGVFMPSRTFAWRMAKLTLATCIMGGALIAIQQLYSMPTDGNIAGRTWHVLLLVGVGACAYFTALIALRTMPLRDMKRALRRSS
jgi:putative peptidoglycan lipid II flippase